MNVSAFVASRNVDAAHSESPAIRRGKFHAHLTDHFVIRSILSVRVRSADGALTVA
ncbi:hypothetical protein [Burkholderia plantarii]|uniref:hypothetical protein n=1 Tax=Burkholderia plantarii TaxID=41899 RepID=UPI0018DDB4D6|nr:hypothetical protein [Burkholderia plantarii]MBI0331014.1 hypothetical protein [Burkholderia plantarii]